VGGSYTTGTTGGAVANPDANIPNAVVGQGGYINGGFPGGAGAFVMS